MPITFDINPSEHIVVMRAAGVLDDQSVNHVRASLRKHPDFDSSMVQLFDMRSAGQITLSAGAVRALASGSIFDRGARRAFVVANDFQFGMSRMFSLYSESHAQRVEVFREVGSALLWLGGGPLPDEK